MYERDLDVDAGARPSNRWSLETLCLSNNDGAIKRERVLSVKVRRWETNLEVYLVIMSKESVSSCPSSFSSSII